MAMDAKKIANDYGLACNSHDLNKILSLFTDDCIMEEVLLGMINHGKKEFSNYLNSIFVDYPDIKFEIKSVFGAGDWAGSESIFSGTHAHTIAGIAATGKTFSVRAVGIYQLHNGKISRETEYFNMATIMQQLGLMPGQPK